MRYTLGIAVAGIAVATLVTGSAVAADLPLKAPPPPPPVSVSWTGWYVGADVGGFGATQNGTTTPYLSPGFGAPAVIGAGILGFGQTSTSQSLNGSSALGGFHTGYNWQWTSNWLVGLEGDYMFAHRSTGSTAQSLETFSAVPTATFNMALNAHSNYLASARARVGWIWNRSDLFYATGGAAWTNTTYTAAANGIVSPPGITGSILVGTGTATTFSNSTTGWVAGAGWEHMITPNWIFRAEYLHYQFNGATGVMGLTTATIGGTACTPATCGWAVRAGDLSFETGRVGISYKF